MLINGEKVLIIYNTKRSTKRGKSNKFFGVHFQNWIHLVSKLMSNLKICAKNALQNNIKWSHGK
jgi:hypothetical protein